MVLTLHFRTYLDAIEAFKTTASLALSLSHALQFRFTPITVTTSGVEAVHTTQPRAAEVHIHLCFGERVE